MIHEVHTVEDVLTRRQIFQQDLGREIALGQRVREHALADVAETLGGCDLDLHACRPVGARPDHTRVDADVARLYPVSNQRPAVGTADRRSGEAP